MILPDTTAIPYDFGNPASILVLAGLMRVIGTRGRLTLDYCSAELEHAPRHDELLQAARTRAARLHDWPDDADADWWLAQVAGTVGDAHTQPWRGNMETLTMLGSQASDGSWSHSWWRMVFGQQRWLRMIRDALEQIDRTACDEWLASHRLPRSVYTGMTGADCLAYRSPALGLESHTSRLSSGHPVSLWLMWEGMHCCPSLMGGTAGWISRRRVRLPGWTTYQSARWLTSVWQSSWLVSDGLDEATVDMGDEEMPAPCITPRQALAGIGVTAIMESAAAPNPPPYAWRLQPWSYV